MTSTFCLIALLIMALPANAMELFIGSDSADVDPEARPMVLLGDAWGDGPENVRGIFDMEPRP